MNLYQIKDGDTPEVLIEYLSKERAVFICALLNGANGERYIVIELETENQ